MKRYFIHLRPEWPAFRWSALALAEPLLALARRQGVLWGRLQGLGFETEALLRTTAADVVTTSAIEGEMLDPGAVRSSVARRLGIDEGGLPAPDRRIDGVVDMMVDATREASQPLTVQRLAHSERSLDTGRFWSLHIGHHFNERQRAMLNRLLGDELVELRTADWARLCRCSPDTALRDIDALVALSILDKGSAGGRSTRYRLVRR